MKKILALILLTFILVLSNSNIPITNFADDADIPSPTANPIEIK